MKDQSKTKQVLIQELASLKQRIEDLEQSESMRIPAEEALRKSEERYRRIAENMSDVVSELDAQGIIRYTSPSYKRVFGDIRHEVIGRSAFDSIHADDRDRVAAVYMEGIRTKTNHEVEYRILHADGHYVWLRSSSNLFFDATGELLGIIVTSSDITERKRIEKALQESEERFRLLSESARDTIWTMDMNLQYNYMNPYIKHALDYTPEEYVAMPLNKTLTPSSLELCMQVLSEELEIEKREDKDPLRSRTIEVEHIHRNGSIVWAEIKMTFIRNAAGQATGILGYTRDITERVRTEKALQESEEKYRLIAENMADVIAGLDMKLRYTYISPSIMRLRGFTVEEAMKETLDQVLTPESFKIALAAFEEEMKMEASGTADPDRARILEVEEYRKDGSTIWVEANLSYLRDKEGKPVGILAVTRDITEWKKQQKEIEHLASFPQLNPIMILEIGKDKEVIFCNPAMQSVLNKMRIEDPRIFIPEDIWELFNATEITIRSEFVRELQINDTFFYENIHFAPEFNSLRIYSTDITERKRAERALRESEDNYRSLFENAPHGIFHSLPGGKFLRVNKALSQMFGYVSPEAMIAAITNIDTQIYIDSKKRSILLDRTLEQPDWVYAENRYRRKDGTTITANLSVRKVLNGDGTVAYLEGFVEDITERKQADEALRESESRFRNVLHDISSVAVQGYGPDGTTQYWNQASERLYGYSAQEAIGRNLVDLIIPPEMREGVEKAIQLMAETGVPIPASELSLMRKDGSRVEVFSSHAIVQVPGRAQELFCIDIDLTERKHAEMEKQALLERTRQLEKMEALGTMAGRVAHDLNNVLGAVSGYSELLAERLPSGNPLYAYAVNIQKSSEKAAAIVEDLLTLTRRGVRVMEVASLNKIITDLLETPEFDKLVSYHPNVVVKTDLAKDLLNVSGSLVHLEKTIMNLVSNAVEAITGSGEVKIKTENRYLDKAINGYQTVKEGEYIILTVSDTGKGIPASELKSIFEPFYTKKSMSRSGTGLGLAIVWGAIQDHNGYIDVQSTEGKGSTFTLYFPTTRERLEDEMLKTPVEQYMGHGESLLVIDDVEEQRNVATALLMQLAYQVNAVSSGEEAVEYLKNNKADILVLDMIMEPGIDGLDTYKRILEVNPHQKAIIVSGFSETERTKEAQRLGAGAYIKKPYLKEKIGVAIRDELAKK